MEDFLAGALCVLGLVILLIVLDDLKHRGRTK